MKAIVVKDDLVKLRARRDRALASVRLTEQELQSRVAAGIATPEQFDAWREVDVVNSLLGG